MHAFNAFVKDERLGPGRVESEPSYYNQGRARGFGGSVSERTTVASIYTRIAIDVAAHTIHHVRTDDEGRYLSDIKSSLNDCLTVSANLDQTGRALFQDAAMSLCEEGVIAIPGIEMTVDPENSGAFDVGQLRVGVITEWKPSRVKVRCWNEKAGEFQEIWQGKKYTPIVQNPMKAVMNEPNSTMKRLMHKLSLLDNWDEISSSGKLDIIIQLPYAIKHETQETAANRRRKDMEMQLKGSKYGVAYTDATEKITQLNRPAENNLLAQVEWLTQKVYSELGITEEVMNGTADEATMINYYNRTIEPILSAIVGELHRKFLTKTARSQNQAIVAFRDAFKYVPISQIAEIADKFTRNEIASTNEIRQIIHMKPRPEPRADELRNANMPVDDTGDASLAPAGAPEEEAAAQTALDSINGMLDDLSNTLGVAI